MVSREVLGKAGLFNEKRYYPEDWEMWLRIFLAGFKFAFLDKDLVIVEIREDSNTTWNIQWILKKNALEMFENIFSQMTGKEKDFYKTERVLRKMKFKLAIAYLMNQRRKEFLETLVGLYRYPFRFFAYLMGGILVIFPSSFVKVCLIKLWKINQLRSYTDMKNKLLF